MTGWISPNFLQQYTHVSFCFSSLAASNAWPGSHMKAGALTFCSVMLECAFKWQSTGMLFFFCLLLTSLLLIAHAVVFFPLYFPDITCHSNHLSLTLTLRRSVDEIRVSLPDQRRWQSLPVVTTQLFLYLFPNKVLWLLLGTWNASLAVQWRIFPAIDLPDTGCSQKQI